MPGLPAVRGRGRRRRSRPAIADGKVKVEYRIVSFLDDASENEYSSRAANALYVVADTAGPDAFAKFHTLLYENQPAEGTAGPDDDQLIAWAVEAGADEAAVRPGDRGQGLRAVRHQRHRPDVARTASTAPRRVFIDGEMQPRPGHDARGRRAADRE